MSDRQRVIAKTIEVTTPRSWSDEWNIAFIEEYEQELELALDAIIRDFIESFPGRGWVGAEVSFRDD